MKKRYIIFILGVIFLGLGISFGVQSFEKGGKNNYSVILDIIGLVLLLTGMSYFIILRMKTKTINENIKKYILDLQERRTYRRSHDY